MIVFFKDFPQAVLLILWGCMAVTTLAAAVLPSRVAGPWRAPNYPKPVATWPAPVRLSLFAWGMVLHLVIVMAAGFLMPGIGWPQILWCFFWAAVLVREVRRALTGKRRDAYGFALLLCTADLAILAWCGVFYQGAPAPRMQTGAYLIKGDGSYDYIADAPPVTWRTYEVHGTTTDEIRASLDANSPQVRGVHYDALTWFNPNWRWWVRGPYGCYLDWSQASYAAVVTLPVLVNDKPIAPDLQARWDIYSDALKAREVEHLKAAPDYMDRLVRTLKSSDCAHANNAAWREWYKIRREELRFYSQDELSFP